MSSVHKNLGHKLVEAIDLALSIIVLLRRSATPFCCGIQAIVSCWKMPWFLQKVIKSVDWNIPPRSEQRVIIFLPVYFSMRSLNSWNLLKASPLVFKKYTHDLHEKSSVKTIKYLDPLTERAFRGPTRSVCIKSSTYDAHCEVAFGKRSWCWRPAMQSGHISWDNLNNGKPQTFSFVDK